MCNPVRELIEGRTPGECVVVAELGVNHNGSSDRALRLLEAARRGGADAVKLQLFEPAELCSRVHREDELRALTRLRLCDADHAALVAAARRLDLPVFGTPFDEPSLELLRRLEIPLIKVGSGEVTHTPFLAEIARTGLPVILSTGGCELADVERAVGTLRDNGCKRLSLLHCVSAYPPPDDQLNLRVIPALARRFPDCTIGFSDHTLGIEAAVAAVTLGARILEKHLTLDCADEGPDHAASADPRAFAAVVAAVRRSERMLGDGRKRLLPCEGTIGRSIVAKRDLRVNQTLTRDDVAFKRPGTGVRPWLLDTLLGRRTARAIPRDEAIVPADLA